MRMPLPRSLAPSVFGGDDHSNEQLESLKVAFGHLEEKHREILLLRWGEGEWHKTARTCREVGEALGVSGSWARERVMKALRRLRAEAQRVQEGKPPAPRWPTRLRNALYEARVSWDADPKEVAEAKSCRELKKRPRVGKKSIEALRAIYQREGIRCKDCNCSLSPDYEPPPPKPPPKRKMKFDRHEDETTSNALRRFFEKSDYLGPAAMVRTQHGDAIVIRVGENLSETWQSGDILFIWPDGEHTAVDDFEEVEILTPDLWSLHE